MLRTPLPPLEKGRSRAQRAGGDQLCRMLDALIPTPTLPFPRGGSGLPPSPPVRPHFTISSNTQATLMPKSRQHEADFTRLNGIGPQDHRLAANELEHRRLQRIDLAVRVELDVAVERLGIGRGNGVA